MPRKIEGIIIALIGVFIICGCIYSINRDLHINLKQANSLTGVITHVEQRETSKGISKYQLPKKIFFFQLQNSDQNFAIHRDDEAYEELKQMIKIGDTIKVYFSPLYIDVNSFNEHVYQVEKNGSVIASYSVFRKEWSAQLGMSLFIGVLFLIGGIIRWSRFNVLHFLRYLAEGKNMKAEV